MTGIAERAFPLAAPHALKAALRAAMVPVYDWLATDVGYPFGYPFDFQFGDKPEWLDPRQLAEAWHRHEPAETVAMWLHAIEDETGCDVADRPRTPGSTT